MRRVFLLAAVILGMAAPAQAQCGLLGRIFHRRSQAQVSACYSTRATACYSSAQVQPTYAAPAVYEQTFQVVTPTPQALAVPQKSLPLPTAPAKSTPQASPQASPQAPPKVPPNSRHRGHTELAPPIAPAPVPVVVVTDPYGFHVYLNDYRARAGLRPLRYSAHLAGWAYQNSLRGFGHFIRVGRRQNAAAGQANAQAVAAQWMNSPAHRDAMLDPTVTTYGIAVANNAWTLNLD